MQQSAPLEPLDLFADVEGPLTQLEALEGLDDDQQDDRLGTAMETLIARVEARTDEEKEMAERSARVMADFADVFPDVLPALTKDYIERTTTRHRIKLVDTAKTHNQRQSNVPRKWRERWKKMLDEHIAAGCLRPSTSSFASAAFIIPKKALAADPHWVNDYRGLNSNTAKDRTPLRSRTFPADAALAKYWGKIDLSNTFFHVGSRGRHREDHYQDAVGPLRMDGDAAGSLQCAGDASGAINEAPCPLIGTDLFTLRVESLGHILSRDGIEADPSKVEKVRNWSRPCTVSQICGLVQYLRKFIPSPAEHTEVFTPLTKKGVADIECLWGEREEKAFEAIKWIVTSLPVLRPVDQDSDEPIWLMTDASKVGIGAVLLQGKDWKTELLAVVAAMKAWQLELLGVPFRVFTDHNTLKHFRTQLTLSKRQSRWMEALADNDYDLLYIPGEQNSEADALSRYSFGEEPVVAVCGISTVALHADFIQRVVDGYQDNTFCGQLLGNIDLSPDFSLCDDLLYFEETRLVVPQGVEVREALLHDAHDALGHFGLKKTLAALYQSFY
ncbi:RHTO0S09e04940g1_1 [Rhodotorula toruloides]|uniref:RHTO0S09e04940g1_1 n=2 Tax=Rhodotorula toruloides TaxID=5286 RepID=A0A061B3V8_RHOTO|nr:reverse transcriptase-RNase H-integrase [Rhodotorula toruloides NP11]EMS22843.1 reverse transcriptase-RNase H-integrase [Rhodotorula toruloides NP11]CDR44496.1 RHTO0S09e04940g1_1 [Rhodotorula toruloides]